MTFKEALSKIFKAKPLSTSEAGKVDSTDIKKTLRDFLVVLVGAVLTWLSANIPNMNFGEYTTLIVPVLTTIVSFVYRFYKDNTKNVEQAEQQIEKIEKEEIKEAKEVLKNV